MSSERDERAATSFSSGAPPAICLVGASAPRDISRVRTILTKERCVTVEVTKALAALQLLYGRDNIEIVTEDGTRVRGIVSSMKTSQALSKPSVKVERADGEIIKIPFDTIIEIIDHNPAPDGE